MTSRARRALLSRHHASSRRARHPAARDRGGGGDGFHSAHRRRRRAQGRGREAAAECGRRQGLDHTAAVQNPALVREASGIVESVHRRRHRREARWLRRRAKTPPGGRSTRTGAAERPASMPCSGRSGWQEAGAARFSSPAWTATARRRFDVALTRAVSDAVGVPGHRLRRRRHDAAFRRRGKKLRRRGACRERVPLRRAHPCRQVKETCAPGIEVRL